MKKKVLKVLGMGLSVYFVAFLAFILDLDGKLLFYLYEPIVTKHFDDMPRKDMTKMPYEMKKYPKKMRTNCYSMNAGFRDVCPTLVS